MELRGTVRVILGTSVLFALWHPGVCQPGDVHVKTKFGTVKGSSRFVTNDLSINTFLGVPYAKAPTGDARFRPPQRVSWQGVLDAVKYGPVCPQHYTLPPSLHMDEDCLNLNIWVPKIKNEKGALPVMVYIHGGSYIEGSGALMNGSQLAQDGVVIVTINYRLGVLGFMSTGDKEAPGNLGMLDQVAAISWVKQSIGQFGGDPDQMTIFGESAGASSVSLHLLSPISSGYRHAISESGVSLVPWAAILPGDSPTPAEMTATLAKSVGCNANTSCDLISCLRRLDAMVLVNASIKVKGPVNRLIWSPVVETVYGFLPDTPERLIKARKFKTIPVIRGTNKDEDAGAAAKVPGIASGVTLDFLLNDLRGFVSLRYQRNVSVIEKAIENVYITPFNTSDRIQMRHSLLQYHSDHDFVASTVLETRNQSMLSPSTFMYTFNYRSVNSFRPSWMGVPHTAELPYVFGAPLGFDPIFHRAWPTNWTADDKRVSRDVIRMWTNFAKYGDPTPNPVGGVKWDRFGSQQSYLSIDRKFSVQSNLRPKAMSLWNTVIPELSKGVDIDRPAPYRAKTLKDFLHRPLLRL